ncbi:coenzyme F420-0:L-glutamate ligase [Ramlibacter tataouinensis]|uniref:coenzyme F420-0:L-glutamate ligase n=1 Tax=Ramlibacter tataouinensis TaxID=94132 RepID=UPI0022F3CAC0|nr:coenzyme F420-0:L-glutamate ligase [Ramlibacter tataouinensis]WBY00536.1 coenzyme F420-0:L-glutamate ligase [Ramlibacter tataouinensis]
MRHVQLFGLASPREIRPGDDLVRWASELAVAEGVRPGPGDVLVFAQKVVSKSEGRIVRLAGIEPSAEALDLARLTGKDARVVELILSESTAVVRATPYVLIVRHRTGVVLANAGIDRSNVLQEGEGESVLLWPLDPDASAMRLHRQACEHFGAHVPVVVNDSLGRAWRRGTVGTVIGAAGLACLHDLRGCEDRHGFRLQTTEVGAADEIAAAASMVMGQASEGIAVVLVRGAAVTGQGCAADLIRPQREDLFP